jgi:hypothetical protein
MDKGKLLLLCKTRLEAVLRLMTVSMMCRNFVIISRQPYQSRLDIRWGRRFFLKKRLVERFGVSELRWKFTTLQASNRLQLSGNSG